MKNHEHEINNYVVRHVVMVPGAPFSKARYSHVCTTVLELTRIHGLHAFLCHMSIDGCRLFDFRLRVYFFLHT